MDIIDAEKRLEDAIKNGTEADVNYWRGYRDAVKAMSRNMKGYCKGEPKGVFELEKHFARGKED